MANKQETLIYIEKENITEAEFMSRNFVRKETKNRAYLNALGAELIMKYLASEGVDIDNLHNVHSISKILEKYDIADILLPNIHLDVRVIFDENQIFIPKTHFENGILPDAYAILKIDNEFKTAEFLGYFKTNQLDKKHENTRYYFFSKDSLISPESFAGFVKRYAGRTSKNISSDDLLRGRELAVALADHNITIPEEHELLGLLMMSDTLRESILEFDNFETLSYSAAPELAKSLGIEEHPLSESSPFEYITDEEPAEEQTNDTENIVLSDEPLPALEVLDQEEETQNLDEATLTEEDFESFFQTEESDVNSEIALNMEESSEVQDNEETQTEDAQTLTPEEILLAEDEDEDEDIESKSEETTDESINLNDETESSNVVSDIENSEIEAPENEIGTEENIFEDNPQLQEPEFTDLGDSLLEDELNTESIPEEAEEQHQEIEDEISSTDVPEDDIEKPETPISQETKIESPTISVDDILDRTIDSIDNDDNLSDSPDKDSKISGTIDNIVKDIAKTTLAAGAATAAAAAAGELAASAAISQEAIKLASVSGDIIENVVSENIENQNKNIDKIDYKKTDIMPDIQEMPENSDIENNLLLSKLHADAGAEASGQFDASTDLSELNKVDVKQAEDSQPFVQETIDLENMDTVENDLFKEEDVSELGNLSDLDFNTKQEDEFLEINNIAESEVVDLPSMSSFTIDEDGTSDIDNISTDVTFNNNDDFEEDLVDIGTSGDLVLDGSYDFGDDTEETFEIPESQSFESGKDDISGIEQDLNLDTDSNFENQNTEITDETTLQSNNLSEEIINPELESMDSTDLYDSENLTQDETVEYTENTDEEPENKQEDWLNSDYENLEDTEIEEDLPNSDTLPEIPDSEMIIEPSEDTQAEELPVKSNSVIISDKTFKVGEIPIDINNSEAPKFDGPESLEEIYDPDSNLPGAALLNNPGTMSRKNQKNSLGFGLGIVGAIIALALVGVIGFSVAKMFKAPTQETPQPITDEAIPEENIDNVSTSNDLELNNQNVVRMDETDRFNNPVGRDRLRHMNPAEPERIQSKPTQKPAKKPDVLTAENLKVNPTPAKVIPPTAFIEIKKLSWEVPDYISYNQSFKQYFQSVGKGLKLALTSDLLLANDYTYSSELKVSVTYDKEGMFKNARIVKSSGSTQIDQIVLQTVNQTLKSLKAPHSVGNDESTTAILKIYL